MHWAQHFRCTTHNTFAAQLRKEARMALPCHAELNQLPAHRVQNFRCMTTTTTRVTRPKLNKSAPSTQRRRVTHNTASTAAHSPPQAMGRVADVTTMSSPEPARPRGEARLESIDLELQETTPPARNELLHPVGFPIWTTRGRNRVGGTM
jgi:hypothetical protein